MIANSSKTVEISSNSEPSAFPALLGSEANFIVGDAFFMAGRGMTR